MRRFLSTCLVAAAVLAGSLILSGCVVVPARGGYRAHVWVPGYWGPPHVWVRGHWRDDD